MQQPKPTKNCLNCGIIIEKPMTVPGYTKYCSVACSHLHKKTANLGKARKMEVNRVKASKKRFTRSGVVASLDQKAVLPYLKHKYDRDPDYLSFVALQPCCVAHSGHCEGDVVSHHVETGGMGTKGSDYLALPLCHAHHVGGDQSVHQLGPSQFEIMHAIDIQQHMLRGLMAYLRFINGKSKA